MRRALHKLLPPVVLAQLRRVAGGLRHRLRRRRVLARTYAGYELQMEIGDEIASAWYAQDWPEPPELRLLRSRSLRPGATVFDLGAHQGMVALVMARIVAPEGIVVALEASPYDAAVAERNRARNAAVNLVVLNAAVAASSGSLSFGLDGRVGTHGSGWPTSQVSARSIDDLAQTYGDPDLVFLDVEGYELEALRGATKTLARSRVPDFFVEVHGAEALARFSATPEEVVACFPPDTFALLAAPPDGADFAPLSPSVVPQQRFFLLALARPEPAGRR